MSIIMPLVALALFAGFIAYRSRKSGKGSTTPGRTRPVPPRKDKNFPSM